MYKKSDFSRIRQLSQPKLRNEPEDLIGPGSYSPSDSYLSTKSMSPRPFIFKSPRFKFVKLPLISIICRTSGGDLKDWRETSLSSSPGVSFERTGHYLKLVENPEFPGAGLYSPVFWFKNKGHVFSKVSKE